MSRLFSGIALLLLVASCAPSGPDPGYAPAAAAQPLGQSQNRPQKGCTGHAPPASSPCGSELSSASGRGLPEGPALGVVPAAAPSPGPVAGAPAPPSQPSLPSLGSPVFGPRGVVGTVVNQTGNTAIVAPVGGGAPGIYVPNGNGTATIFQPGGVPVVVPNPP